ncbi:MAG TPA: GH1 family beta-glucosidase [Fimbriimonas sp.]|nr:GH1 family beta-glucosidase [Fimbriimonas sp.]
MPDSLFPSDFMWGAATASYQIEGAVTEDGRGASVWDTFSHTDGKVAKGENGDVACDHYHRYESDADLIAELGIPNYRFSIAWPRLFPKGVGELNPKGVEFYDRLVDALLARKINPVVTLFHWDYPQALEDQGGWTHPDAHKWFGDYADVVFKALGDRVKHWITLNEPWCHAYLGNGAGVHAPGNKSETLPYQVGHGLLLGHGEALARYRATGQEGVIGLTTNHYFAMPYSQSEEDLKAKSQFDDWNVGWFLDPIYKGDYPEFLKSRYQMPEFTAETSKLVSQKTDFMGLNFYQGDMVKWNPAFANDAEQVPLRQDNTTQMGWQRVPETLTYTLVESQKKYNPAKIVITENGCAYEDSLINGKVHDPLRMQFLRDYICAVEEAIESGVRVGGYFAWSLMDNFEWGEGYRPTFGLVHVDYETQVRTPKDSALMYRDIIRTSRV